MIRTAFLIAALAGAATPALAALPTGFKARADALVAAAYPADGPGAVVLVTEGGKPAYRAARGLADVEGKKPITADTVFRYGSITKQFAAATLLRYVERGKVRLDDPLTRFLPGYPGGDKVTVRMLLDHSSGIASYTGIPGWMQANVTKDFTTRALVDSFKDAPADFAPGADWRYNNSGYVLVGAVIEAVSGKPWADAVRDELLAPLKLASIRPGTTEAKIPAMARGYGFDGTKVIPAPAMSMTVPGAAGALDGTADDLARWADALHHGRVVSAASYAAMTAPMTVADGSTRPYGFGLQLEPLRGQRQVGHSGGIFGFSTDSVYLPDADLFVTVLTNSDAPQTPPGMVARRLAALALGKPFVELAAQPLDPARAAALAGVYRFEDGERRISLEDGKLYWQRGDQAPRELLSAGGDRYFFGPQAFDYVDVSRAADGKPALSLHRDGAETGLAGQWSAALPVTAPVALSAAALDALAGHFDSPVGPVVVARAGAGLTFKLGEQGALPLRAVTASEFVIREVGATILFTADGLVIKQAGREIAARRVAK